jgi:hypothetical protein
METFVEKKISTLADFFQYFLQGNKEGKIAEGDQDVSAIKLFFSSSLTTRLNKLERSRMAKNYPPS